MKPMRFTNKQIPVFESGENGLDARGMERLVRMGRKRFRIPENLNHYSPEDFATAERQFVKECILLGKCSL
jgi:hypothetical protein